MKPCTHLWEFIALIALLCRWIRSCLRTSANKLKIFIRLLKSKSLTQNLSLYYYYKLQSVATAHDRSLLVHPQTPTHHTNLNSIPTAIQLVSTSISTDLLIYFSNTSLYIMFFCLCLCLFVISDHVTFVERWPDLGNGEGYTWLR